MVFGFTCREACFIDIGIPDDYKRAEEVLK